MKRARSFLLMLMMAVPAAAQIDVGSDGSDGVFDPAGNTTVDLSQAVTAAWDTPSPQPGKGVYDPDKWAIVFKYSSVNVASGRTITFINHPSRAPVVWLVQGSATIAGTINLNGATGHSAGVNVGQAEPGPGGFRGGRGEVAPATSEGSAGFGPGGASYNIADATHYGTTASHGTLGVVGTAGGGAVGPTYNSASIMPLFGGSGGAAGRDTSPTTTPGGGGGGGAMLLAANNTMSVFGTILANGGDGVLANGLGSGGGSGGAIRLVGSTVDGAGAIRAVGSSVTGQASGKGRIRIEGNIVTLGSNSDPAYTTALPGPIWPPSNLPRIKATFLGSQTVPATPLASLIFPQQDVSISDTNPVTLTLQAENVPLNWSVSVRVIPKTGQDTRVNGTYQSGSEALSIWTAQVTLPDQFSVIQARASAP